MKKLTLCILVGLTALLMTSADALAAGPLRVGFASEPYPPFTYKAPSGKWTGFEIDLTDAICAKLEPKCRHVPTAWAGIIPALKTGKIDMILGSMSITPAREKVISFTRPYYTTRADYVAPKSMKVQLPQGLKGKILGVQGGTTSADYAHKKLAPMGVRLKIYNQQEQLNRDLLAHRVDIMLADSVAMTQFVKRDSAKNYAIKGMAPRDPAIFGKGIGIGVRKQDKQLQAKLNKAVQAVLKKGQCSKLSEQYFGTDICAKP